MKFRTNISKNKAGKHTIRGKELTTLIEENSFIDVVFLLLRGDIPSKSENALLNAVFVASVEHGIEVPSLFVPRVSASVGNDMQTALAAGILSIGEKHGGAAEQAAEVFSSGMSAEKVVDSFQKEKKVIPGFGHKHYKDEDPRATALYKKIKTLKLSSGSFNLAYEIESELAKVKGKKICLNIDGAIAASMLTLRLGSGVGKALFILPRILGMTAHILEEYEQKNSYYRLEESDVEEG